jgi:hypothetical protein
MTRDKKVHILTKADLDWFAKSDPRDTKHALVDMLKNGYKGFDNMTDKELDTELRFRGLDRKWPTQKNNRLFLDDYDDGELYAQEETPGEFSGEYIYEGNDGERKIFPMETAMYGCYEDLPQWVQYAYDLHSNYLDDNYIPVV